MLGLGDLLEVGQIRCWGLEHQVGDSSGGEQPGNHLLKTGLRVLAARVARHRVLGPAWVSSQGATGTRLGG